MPTYESIGNASNISSSWVTTAGTFDNNFSSHSILSIGVGFARMSVVAASQNVWFRSLIRTPTNVGIANSGDFFPFRCYNAINEVVVELFLLNTGTNGLVDFTLRYMSGGSGTTPTFTSHPILTALNATTLYMFDFHVVTGAGSGRIEVYLDDNLIYNITGINNGTSNIRSMDMYAMGRESAAVAARGAYYSEFLIGIGNSSPTVGRRIFSRFPLADSTTNNAWIGDAAQINTGGKTTDGDMAFTDAAGNRQGYTIAAAPLYNSRIEAVALQTQIFVGDGSPRSLQHSLYIASTNYDQSTLTVSGIPTYYETVFYTNPNTAGTWTVPAFNGTEWGVIST